MRNMSFSLTTSQILDRSKTVTRRTGWKFLKPGDRIRAVKKAMGLKKGEKVQQLAVLEVIDVRRERIDCMSTDPAYGGEECVAEGFPQWLNTPECFVKMFCETHVIPDTRIGPPKHLYRPPFPCLLCDEVNAHRVQVRR